jgi:hypothetical protein
LRHAAMEDHYRSYAAWRKRKRQLYIEIELNRNWVHSPPLAASYILR